jgi:hypothetical protein
MGRSMQYKVLRSQASLMVGLCAGLYAGCSASDRGNNVVNVPAAPDAGQDDAETPDEPAPVEDDCTPVEVDGTAVTERLQDFTARFEVGTAYNRTVMLFGGMKVDKPNTPSRAYIYGLDKVDAQRMAEKYPDFYLCSSIGGQEAASYIRVYDIVPASCEIQKKLEAAFRQYDRNAARGGDRTSLHLEGSPLTVVSVTEDATGKDVSKQVSEQQFHLITGVQQLTGESLLKFGTTK